jgi:myosin heavy subunit
MGSPRSPTRPHSMRRRQSMQVFELESKLEQLASENKALAEANAQHERSLQTSRHTSSSLVEKDAEIDALKRTLDWLQNEVTRLTEVNDGLTSANVTLGRQHDDRYSQLESQHAQATRELQEVRDSHNNLTTGMQGIVAKEIQNSVQDKDREIAQLRAELEAAKNQIREMQRQILASKANDVDFLTIRDEDYFDNACQQLCQHVQQWVLRFSKFSDMRACRLTSELNNDKTIDRLDNAILDGSDVDSYLADRVKRRDVFMSMTMTMVWEFVFTRYLFGMDREQRQKLKSLEKLLSDVGPAAAVHQWRATTLTLLSKRDAFIQQREQDTQAVVHAILETLSEILPPPSHLEAQIEEQLKRVMKAAVDLSIEMRTQRAEYMMLPPLQPEYDANGDLASKVSFNAALMNERSGDTVSNEELEEQKAVVRIVLFPLVVKKGDDRGEGDEEIVVCPAQVLVAKPKKQVRIYSGGSTVGNPSRISMQSSMPPADMGDNAV